MKSFLTGFIFSVAVLLLPGCGTKEESITPLTEETMEVESQENIYDVILENGIFSLYTKHLPQLTPCLILNSQYNELSIHYDVEFGMIWVSAPTIGLRENWEFTVNGKSVISEDHDKGMIFAFIKNGKTNLKRYTFDQLLKGQVDLNMVGLNSLAVSDAGYGIKFEETDVVMIKGLSTTARGTLNFKVTYSPNEGWNYQCDEPELYYGKLKADVFGFSKNNLLDQFKEVFKTKKECRFRFNRPHTDPRLTKFTHVEYVFGVDDDDFADFGDITVTKDFIRIDGKKLTDRASMKGILRENLLNLWAMQMGDEKFYPYRIDFHDDSSDALVRLLFEELDHSDMNDFEMRVLPKKKNIQEEN